LVRFGLVHIIIDVEFGRRFRASPRKLDKGESEPIIGVKKAK